MLTGITSVTTGSVRTHGRTAALLELGMGFHSEFTGRQNALIAGQLLGYSAAQVAQLMPEIESFAGIGHYIDQPVRVYSSGMQVRLAFSVATAIRPDILIIDEALSVGDTEFQHRSYDRIRQFREQGTSLLFVSHDKGVIINLCDRAILLDQGKIAIEGDPEVVMDYYNAMLARQPNQAIAQSLTDDGKIQTESGSGEVILTHCCLLNAKKTETETLTVGELVCLRISLLCMQEISKLVAGYMIKDRFGQVIFGTNSFYYQQQIHQLQKNETVEYYFNFPANLGPGTYSISIALHGDENHIDKNYLWKNRAILFTVINGSEESFVGVNWIRPTVSHFRQPPK
jgi:lipopolysaccharide transport system ATP-binding protein